MDCRRETIQNVMDIIERCNESLYKWNKNNFGNVHKHLVKAKQSLQHVQSMDQCMTSNDELKEAQKDVHLWLECEEMMWKQRSKVI